MHAGGWVVGGGWCCWCGVAAWGAVQHTSPPPAGAVLDIGVKRSLLLCVLQAVLARCCRISEACLAPCEMCTAGLFSCREVVGLLRELKKEATLLVVSHDLADIAPLVDCAWRMKVRGWLLETVPEVSAHSGERVVIT